MFYLFMYYFFARRIPVFIIMVRLGLSTACWPAHPLTGRRFGRSRCKLWPRKPWRHCHGHVTSVCTGECGRPTKDDAHPTLRVVTRVASPRNWMNVVPATKAAFADMCLIGAGHLIFCLSSVYCRSSYQGLWVTIRDPVGQTCSWRIFIKGCYL